MKEKILIIIPSDAWGGAESLLKKVVAFCKSNSKIDVVFFNNSGTGYWEDLSNYINPVYLSKKSESHGFFKYLFRSLLKKQSSYDYIITTHVYLTSLVGILLCLRRLKTKFFIARESTSIFLRYSGFKLTTYKMAYFFGYRHIDLLICQTETMKAQLIENRPFLKKRSNVTVLSNPVSIEYYDNMAKLTPTLNLPENYIVTAGRFIPEKGHDILINAFYKLKQVYPTFKLIILGGFGPLEKDIKDLISLKQLDDSVILPEFTNNVFPYFKEAKLCVLSSRIEGFPNVLLEMISQNTNIVSTLCADGIEDIPEIIKVKPNDTQALFDGMIYALENIDVNTFSKRQKLDIFLKSRDISEYVNLIKKKLHD